MNNLDGVVEALVELYGPQEIGLKMVEIRHRKMEQVADGHQGAFDKAVEDGQLAKVGSSQKTDVVVVTQQTSADGTVMFPTRVFLPVSAYTPEAQKLLGFVDGKLTRALNVGDKIEMPGLAEAEPSRGAIAILALYEPVVKSKAEKPADTVAPEEQAVAAATMDTIDAPALPTETA